MWTCRSDATGKDIGTRMHRCHQRRSSNVLDFYWRCFRDHFTLFNFICNSLDCWTFLGLWIFYSDYLKCELIATKYWLKSVEFAQAFAYCCEKWAGFGDSNSARERSVCDGDWCERLYSCIGLRPKCSSSRLPFHDCSHHDRFYPEWKEIRFFESFFFQCW